MSGAMIAGEEKTQVPGEPVRFCGTCEEHKPEDAFFPSMWALPPHRKLQCRKCHNDYAKDQKKKKGKGKIKKGGLDPQALFTALSGGSAAVDVDKAITLVLQQRQAFDLAIVRYLLGKEA